MEELYTTWKAIGVAGGDLSFFQDFFVKFYQAFIEGDRWLQYLNGVKTTLLVTAIRTERNFFIGITSFHFTSALPRRFFCARRGENALHYTQYSQKMQVLFSKKSRRNRMK